MPAVETELSQMALETLALFGWVVVEEQQDTLIVADDSGWWSTTYQQLNAAALSTEERQDVLDSDPEELWDAHSDWCDKWESTWAQ